MPALQERDGGFDFTFNRRMALDSGRYRIETSSTLLPDSWTELTGGSVRPPPHPELESYEILTVPVPTESKVFLRVNLNPGE